MVAVRRVLFQVHRWAGLALGLYIIVIAVSGSLIVFRLEFDRLLCPSTERVSASGRRVAELCEPEFVSWLAEFHGHLAAGQVGLLINGLGAMAVTLMCVTGALLWWPGRSRLGRALVLHRGLSARRLIAELHGVAGIWLLPFIVLWTLTACYFAFPGLVNALDDRLMAGRAGTRASDFLEDAVALAVRLHFGRTFGPGVEGLWAILGVAPCLLVVTGVLMWWHGIRRSR